MKAPPKIYFDITELLEFAQFNSTLSGIQRVSVALLNRIVDQHGPGAITLVAFRPKAKRIVYYDAAYFGGDFTFHQGLFCDHFGLEPALPPDGAPKPPGPRYIGDYIRERYGRGLRARFQHSRLVYLNRRDGGRTFVRRGITATPIVERVEPILGEAHKIAPGDIVFLSGATWCFNRYTDILEQMARDGVTICQFMHDLIPLAAPEHADADTSLQFSRWLGRMSGIASNFIANSNATAADLRRYFVATGCSPKPFAVTPLAHEFLPPAALAGPAPTYLALRYANIGPVASHVLNAARKPYALCVGTIESRKNLWMLVQVWKSLYEELGPQTPQLLLAGKKGWLNADLDGLMTATGGVHGLVHYVERPSDYDLQYLYRNSLFSICASFYEGWGLPIGESLWLGRPVACSNVSAMPEAGGEWADYFDPNSFADMRAKIHRLIVDAPYRESRAQAIDRSRLRSWDDVARDLWRALQAIAAG